MGMYGLILYTHFITPEGTATEVSGFHSCTDWDIMYPGRV